MKTYIPEGGPAYEIWVIDLALRINMLAGAYHHGLCWSDIDQWSLSWIGVRHPDRYGKAICGASKYNGYGTREAEK